MFSRISKKAPRLSIVVPVVIALCYIVFFVATPSAFAAEDKCKADVGKKGILTESLSNECINCGTCDKCDFVNLIAGIANGSLKVVGPIGVFTIALSGFFYIISAGKAGGESNMQGIARAKMALSASIIGMIIAVTAWLIINTILGMMGYIGFGGGKTINVNGIVQPAPWYRIECSAKDLHIDYDIKIG